MSCGNEDGVHSYAHLLGTAGWANSLTRRFLLCMLVSRRANMANTIYGRRYVAAVAWRNRILLGWLHGDAEDRQAVSNDNKDGNDHRG